MQASTHLASKNNWAFFFTKVGLVVRRTRIGHVVFHLFEFHIVFPRKQLTDGQATWIPSKTKNNKNKFCCSEYELESSAFWAEVTCSCSCGYMYRQEMRTPRNPTALRRGWVCHWWEHCFPGVEHRPRLGARRTLTSSLPSWDLSVHISNSKIQQKPLMNAGNCAFIWMCTFQLFGVLLVFFVLPKPKKKNGHTLKKTLRQIRNIRQICLPWRQWRGPHFCSSPPGGAGPSGASSFCALHCAGWKYAVKRCAGWRFPLHHGLQTWDCKNVCPMFPSAIVNAMVFVNGGSLKVRCPAALQACDTIYPVNIPSVRVFCPRPRPPVATTQCPTNAPIIVP